MGRAEPNLAHYALAALERWYSGHGGEFLLVTQNVDSLHEGAGSEHIVKVHGSAERLRCSRHGCSHGAPLATLPASDFDLDLLRREPTPEHLPRCPECGAVIRAHVLLFDEYYDEHADYQFERILRAAARMQLLLFVGTSFSVGVTELLLRSAAAEATPTYSIDPEPQGAPTRVREIALTAEAALSRLCAEIGIGPELRTPRGR